MNIRDRNHLLLRIFILLEKASEKHKIADANEAHPMDEIFCKIISVSFESELSGLCINTSPKFQSAKLIIIAELDLLTSDLESRYKTKTAR